jgi:hypothetical protein
VNPFDLTAAEQDNVRKALRFLHARCGGWVPLAKVLRAGKQTVRRVAGGRSASASMAVRVAKLAQVGVDDVLGGKYPPPGCCPHCGHMEEV